MPKYIGVKEVDQQEFVNSLAIYLKKLGKLDLPNNSDVLRLSPGNELSPYDPDWFYLRAASIMRHLYMRRSGLTGLRRVYGKKQNNGSRPSHRVLASSTHLRKACQALEKLGYLEKHPEDGGRIVTSQGRQVMDRIACQIQVAQKKKRKTLKA